MNATDIALLIATPTGIAALGGLLRWAYRSARHLDRLVTVVAGDEEATPPIPPLREWQVEVDRQLANLTQQFQPNGGQSARDTLDDLDANVRALAQAQGVPLPRPPRRG